MEPERPTPADTWRRVAVGSHCSITLDLDPQRPRAPLAELRYMGSEAAVAPLRQSMHARCDCWDPARCVAHLTYAFEGV